MHVRLATLHDLEPVSRMVVGSFTRPPIGPRNATASEAVHQARLRAYLKALVDAYGYRADHRGTSPPWQVPYLPMPFAGEMLAYFDAQARYWLGRSVPDGAKQPQFIRVWTGRAAAIIGAVSRAGLVTSPNVDSYEDAPASVAAKAPSFFKADRPAGKPHPKVLKAAATWQFLDALIRLAIHFDALAGQPTKLDLFIESAKEQAEELGDAAGRALQGVAELPGKIAGTGRDALKWAAIAALGLGALYVVSR